MPRLLATLPYAAVIGGVEGYFADLAVTLPASGWDVHALAMPPGGGEVWKPPAYWDHVTVIGKPWWSVRDYAGATRAAIQRLRPDLVLTYAYDAPLISGPNVPEGPRVVEGVHTGLPTEVDRIRTWQSYFDGLLAIGQGTRAVIETALESVADDERPPVRTIRYGLRLPPVPPLPSEPRGGPLKLIWFGRIRRAVKRVMDLVPIGEGLVRASIPFHLTVLGEGPDLEDLRRLTAEHLPAGAVSFLQSVPHERVFEILTGHDVFLSTSECEGGPRTLLEAMSCHVVPVVTDIPGYSQEVVVDGANGFRVPVGDTTAFIERIGALGRDRDLLRRLAASCRPSVDPAFTVQRMAKETDAYFREILARPPRRQMGRAAQDLAAHLAGRWRWLPGGVRRFLRWTAWTSGLLPGLHA